MAKFSKNEIVIFLIVFITGFFIAVVGNQYNSAKYELQRNFAEKYLMEVVQEQYVSYEYGAHGSGYEKERYCPWFCRFLNVNNDGVISYYLVDRNGRAMGAQDSEFSDNVKIFYHELEGVKGFHSVSIFDKVISVVLQMLGLLIMSVPAVVVVLRILPEDFLVPTQNE